MKIYVAGAGAGKTTALAKHIIELREKTDIHKILYCITFTNNAVACIKKKLLEHYATIPINIIVSTIHSFLYNEFIKPYYFLLYKKQYAKISVSELPNTPQFKNAKLSRLDHQNILHQTDIPQKAKFVICKKSSDNKKIIQKRKVILNKFYDYCGAICIDEAQDIDDNIFEIIKQFKAIGIELLLMGDPKQDLWGTECFKKLIDEYKDYVEYLEICHRCPQCHIEISNRIVSDLEKQISHKKEGAIHVYFESKINCDELIKSQQYDLKYISSKRDGFDTHKNNSININQLNLEEEIENVLKDLYPFKSSVTLKRISQYFAEGLIKIYFKSGDKKKAMAKVFSNINLEKKNYGIIINAIPEHENKSTIETVTVSSIDSIKGQEGQKCLFILTTDLASYLFQSNKKANKTKNHLYVALTRSLDILDIYITRKVEEIYSKEMILSFFNF